jgi:hypothetical protein
LLFYLTVLAGQLGCKVVEIPVTRAYPGGERPPTKISGFRGRLGILRESVARRDRPLQSEVRATEIPWFRAPPPRQP